MGKFDAALGGARSRRLWSYSTRWDGEARSFEFHERCGRCGNFFEAEVTASGAGFGKGEKTPAHTWKLRRQATGERLLAWRLCSSGGDGKRDHVAVFVVTARGSRETVGGGKDRRVLFVACDSGRWRLKRRKLGRLAAPADKRGLGIT